MKKFRFLTLMLVMSAFVFVSCGKSSKGDDPEKNSIVGCWMHIENDGNWHYVEMYKFGSDGKLTFADEEFVITSSGAFEERNTSKASGTYTQKGDKLDVTITLRGKDYSFSNLPVSFSKSNLIISWDSGKRPVEYTPVSPADFEDFHKDPQAYCKKKYVKK